MVIIFQSEKARDFLLFWGWVFTFRTRKRKKLGRDWMTDRRGGKKIVDVWVLYWAKVHISKLTRQHVKYSGFETKKEWLEEIKRLNHGILPEVGYVYKVEKREGGEKDTKS
jgi:hypothetical protein